MPKVSFIIPVYNGETYLHRCIDSVLNQDFTDFEVIIINDGSTDSSWDICKSYSKKDNRVKLYIQRNKGVSAARNAGLKIANGEFITFVDCDDWIESTMLSKMISIIDTEKIDIVYLNFVYESGNSQYVGNLYPFPLRKNDITSFPLAILFPEASSFYDHVKQDHDILGAACGKLYRRKLLNDSIRFDESLEVAEDCLFNLECFTKSSDIYIDNTPVYHYTIHPNSANHKMRTDIIRQGENFYNSFSAYSQKLDESKAFMFEELIKYRCYYDLITRHIDHVNNDNSLFAKYKELSTCLQNPIYSFSYEIPKFLNLFKRIELFSLKHKLYFCLLILNRIRTIIKPKLKPLK